MRVWIVEVYEYGEWSPVQIMDSWDESQTPMPWSFTKREAVERMRGLRESEGRGVPLRVRKYSREGK